MRTTSYALQSLGVAESNVSAVIETVCHKMTKQRLSGDLPAPSTQNRFGSEMKALARQHLKEKTSGMVHGTIMYDGTTKRSSQVTEVELAIDEGPPMLLGVRRQSGSKATDYVTTIRSAMEDVENIIDPISVSSSAAAHTPLLDNITNTMTDRCVTNMAVDRHLSELKGCELNSFKCAAHPLDSFFKVCDKSVKTFEEEHPAVTPTSIPLYTRAGESKTHTTLRKVSDLFHDEGKGCFHLLTAFLKDGDEETHQKKTHLYQRFVGNRLNVYFLLAATLFYYQEKISDFFTHVQQPTNDLQRIVHETIRSGVCTVPLRALGIISKLITGPWMRHVLMAPNILDVNQFYQNVQVQLRRWSHNAWPMLQHGTSSVSDLNAPILRDAIYEKLLVSDDTDISTESLLRSICSNILTVVDRQLADQLPEGKFWEPSNELRLEAESCCCHNISGERKMGMVDSLCRRCGNMTFDKMEARLMFKSNKTGPWLEQKSNQEVEMRVAAARREGRKLRDSEAEARKGYQAELILKLQTARTVLEQKEEKARSVTEKLVEDILDIGLWCSSNDVDHAMQGMSRTRQLKTLKSQIQMRKALGCKSTFAVTKNPPEEMRDHLLSLLDHDISAPMEHVVSLLNHPDVLVGKHVEQSWKEGTTVTNYNGEVLGIVKEEYTFRYEGNPQLFYLTTSEVITDIMRGDLKVLW